MGHLDRDKLVNFHYVFICILALASVLVVVYVASPEKIIQGEWIETGWYFEKPDAPREAQGMAAFVEDNIRREILERLEILHVESWVFHEDGTLEVHDDKEHSDLRWAIKGRGHILDIMKDGKSIESFQIQKLTKNQMQLFLNIDMQIRGIIKINLERKDNHIADAQEVQ